MSYVEAGYSIGLGVLFLYAVALVLRRRRWERALRVIERAEPADRIEPARRPDHAEPGPACRGGRDRRGCRTRPVQHPGATDIVAPERPGNIQLEHVHHDEHPSRTHFTEGEHKFYWNGHTELVEAKTGEVIAQLSSVTSDKQDYKIGKLVIKPHGQSPKLIDLVCPVSVPPARSRQRRTARTGNVSTAGTSGRDMRVAIGVGVLLGIVGLVCFAAGTVATMVIVTIVVLLATAEAYAAFRRAAVPPGHAARSGRRPVAA